MVLHQQCRRIVAEQVENPRGAVEVPAGRLGDNDAFVDPSKDCEPKFGIVQPVDEHKLGAEPQLAEQPFQSRDRRNGGRDGAPTVGIHRNALRSLCPHVIQQLRVRGCPDRYIQHLVESRRGLDIQQDRR